MIDTIISFVIESRLPEGGMTAFGPSSKKLYPGSPLLPHVTHRMDTRSRVKGVRGLLSQVFLTVQGPPVPRFQTSAWDGGGDCYEILSGSLLLGRESRVQRARDSATIYREFGFLYINACNCGDMRISSVLTAHPFDTKWDADY